MKNPIVLIACLTLLAAALACDAGAAAPISTLIASPLPPTVQLTNPSAPDTQATVAQPTSQPTIAPPTAEPTQAQPSFPTPTQIAPPSAPPSAPTSAGVSRVKIYLVAIGDNGKSGPKIGCEDSMVGVDRDIAPTKAPLQAALKELFSIRDQFYGQSGLYNSLYTSNLTIVKVVIDDAGLATINLSGTISLAGECDDPRFEAQIEYTAKQFSTVKDVAVFVNDKPLKELIGGMK